MDVWLMRADSKSLGIGHFDRYRKDGTIFRERFKIKKRNI